MSSWFNTESLKSLTDKVHESMDKVQKSMPKIDKEMIEKLTLTTPELTAERQRIDQEERHKEAVRDSLAGMLPWETRDSERDILVEECKEAILKLSSEKETFFGPYRMPETGIKEIEKVKSEGEDEEEAGDEEEEEHPASKYMEPSEESLEKLKKLEPLPKLLADFDLDSHVGLINRLLECDPKLVEMQSKLSGGGEREKTFWHNYFFHCAFTRYEAGLSIDEIWSDQPPAPAEEAAEDAAAEETITFDNDKDQGEEASPEKAFRAEPETDADAPFSKETPEKESTSAGSPDGADFEMVGGSEDGAADDDDEEAVDYELDELEAEIARELED